MPLQKGFLRPKITLQTLNLDKRKLIFGGLWWTALTFSIYTFLCSIRELFRYESFWHNYEDFLVLTPFENYFYNFVFACFAGIFAFSAISNHWLRRPLTLKNLESNNKAAVFQDKTSYSWNFTYWFSKLSILFGVQSCFMGVFLNFSLFPDYAIVLVLMGLSLFFHEWLTLRRVYKNSILPWMAGVMFLIVGAASIFSFVNMIPYKKLNESVIKNTVSYNLSIELPKTESSKAYERLNLMINIYLGFSKVKSDTLPKIAVKNFNSPFATISVDQIGEFVEHQKSIFDEFTRDDLVWRLNIDKKVKMKYVKELKDSLSRSDARKIQYASSDDHSNGLVSSCGLMQLLPVHESSDYPQSPFFMERDNDVVLELLIRNDTIWFQDSVVLPVKVRTIVRNFVKRNGRSGIIKLGVDDESNFESYIALYDQLISIVTELRDEWTFNNYRIHYFNLDPYDLNQRRIDDSTRVLFPMLFIEK